MFVDHKISIYFCLSIFLLGCAYGKDNRIIGGQSADSRDFPYLISFRLSYINTHICGGAMILTTAVLTAAHCFYKKESLLPFISVHAGISNLTHSGSITSIKKIFMHPEFVGSRVGSNGYHNDIAIVAVSEPFEINEYQNLIILASEPVNPGANVTLCGWGLTSYPSDAFPTQIHCAAMPVKKCSESEFNFDFDVPKDQLCTHRQGVGVCTGDSGGPVIKDGQIIGIISFCKLCATEVADVHTNLYMHMGFIHNVVYEQL